MATIGPGAWTLPSAVPLSDNAPVSEATLSGAGVVGSASREDHIHKRLSSTTVQQTDSNGLKFVAFTRLFPSQPGILCTPHGVSPGGQPLLWEIQSFQQDGSLNYTGCTVQFYRTRTIPQSLATLLLSAVYNLFSGSVGVTEFTCVAIMASN